MKKLLTSLCASTVIMMGAACAAPLTFETTSTGGHSAWMPFFENTQGLDTYGNSNGSDFDFVPHGRLVLNDNGSGSLSGTIQSQVNPTYQFEVSIDLVRRNGPGSGGPKRELSANSYSENGGPIDTSTWQYYDLVGGSLTGLNAFDGVSFDIAQRPYDSVFPMQYGLGASGKNYDLGLAVWFYVTANADCTADICQQFAGRTFGGDFNLNMAQTPLPAGVILFATGIAGMAGARGRKRSV